MKVKWAGVLYVVCGAFVLSGCADVKTPSAHYALTHPLSTKTMVTPGTSKDEVLEKWGQPYDIIALGYDDMGISKEAWIYNAWFPHAPLDYRHFSKKKKIYFIGDYAIGYEDIADTNEKD
ncbi:MAG: DUF2845 domain-containing protein [Candidatus Omnitrophica bacterium]|nr:DUF2845 domain-containing protein [Candidatus Omnitrophota bacterium]MBU1932624.1 DUF2845 domain-containing protein [Candidatus Omnitrophota bacterium]